MSILLGHKNKKEILKHRKLLAPFVHGNMPALQGPAENTMRIQEKIITWLPYQSQLQQWPQCYDKWHKFISSTELIQFIWHRYNMYKLCQFVLYIIIAQLSQYPILRF
jgi:hypothetical protein